MKKQTVTLALSLLIITACLFSACGAEQFGASIFPSDTSSDNQGSSTTTDYAAAIQNLEDRILELQQSQYISDAEYEKELASLLSKLEALQSESKDKTPSVPEDGEEAPPPEEKPTDSPSASPLFLYTVTDDLITITGYTGKDSHVVIPYAIDGLPVYAIGEGAFSSDTIRTITISDGVSRIDWFAFRDCPNLTHVTVPQSVTRIGYEAFGARDSTFTLYCHANSFAQTYAQSYGITYATI